MRISKPKRLILIQARMNSARLPGKVLKPVLGKPLLAYELERLTRVRLADEIVVATTVHPSDDAIVDFCRASGVSFYRGSEEDVLSRFYEAAKNYSANTIVRVTADCPLIDPGTIDRVIHFFAEGGYDYASNVLRRTFPRGMDVEVFTFAALETTHNESKTSPEREHVTPFIYNRPERFRLGGIQHPSDESGYRWTVDTPEDFSLIEKILTALYPSKPSFDLADLLELAAGHPEWSEINRQVKQKVL